MRRMMIQLLACFSVLWFSVARAADDLKPLVEPTLQMPAPVPIAPAQVSYLLPDRRAHWQNYGVDRNGRWVPRVALTGDGAFYWYNGMPYLLLPVNQLNVMPYLLD